MKNVSQPNWLPITALPKVAWAIDGMTESAHEQLGNLQQAQGRPGALDQATRDRLVTAYTTQQGDLPLYREQLARWQTLPLDQAQQTDVTRLEAQLATLTEHITAILALAAAVQSQTIEAILGMSDADLAAAVLSGNLPLPGAPKK